MMYMNSTPPSSVATDFDLFLLNRTTNSYVYASQSIDDNSEGFDVILPSDGDYEVLLEWPSGNAGCGGTKEPISWAFAVQ
jgi:hypothetical protein